MMGLLPGVYTANKKDGTLYFRASITYRNKHISLGSYQTEHEAHEAYMDANKILSDDTFTLEEFLSNHCTKSLPFEKSIILINFRDNKLYFKTPIYIKKRYFLYFLSQSTVFKFAADDLFYYADHKIMKRGGHLFVSDFGMQVNILARYGIKNFAVCGKDYRFVNGDSTDYRYENIEIINKYHGVCQLIEKGLPIYKAKIHINGDFIIGKYGKEVEAAIAYNKAVDILLQKGLVKNFTKNYIVELSHEEYRAIYQEIKISNHILEYEI